jgi:hypothetical protein
MGNDGGSIPGRQDLVKQKKRERKMKTELIDKARATYCALSKEVLKKPLVICRLGNIYNKRAIVSALVEKKIPKCFAHIHSLKDVREANVCLRSAVSGHEVQGQAVEIMCPITQMIYNGILKFVFNWSCGCVLSEKAVHELQSAKARKCISCNKPYTSRKWAM